MSGQHPSSSTPLPLPGSPGLTVPIKIGAKLSACSPETAPSCHPCTPGRDFGLWEPHPSVAIKRRARPGAGAGGEVRLQGKPRDWGGGYGHPHTAGGYGNAELELPAEEINASLLV